MASFHSLPLNQKIKYKNRNIFVYIPENRLNRYVKIYCVDCDDLTGESIENYAPDLSTCYWCKKCKLNHANANLPIKITNSHTIIADFGDSVSVIYHNNGNKEENKTIYNSNKGRSIKIQGKKIYID